MVNVPRIKSTENKAKTAFPAGREQKQRFKNNRLEENHE
jgi:hypothetical protein